MNYTGDEMDLKDIKKKVKKSMDKQRYDHTKGVMYTAGCLAMANEYPIDKAMLAGLLHAKAGMVLAEEEYQITDPDILHSIKVHTTGEPGMNMLDKIIFVADYIEPGRNEAPRLEYLRKIAFHDIDMTVAEILHDTIHYLNSKSGAIDPATQITYNYYERYRKETH